MTYSIEIGKKEYEFDISGVKKGRIMGEQGRKEALIQLIKNNPNIQHTHLLAIVNELNLMPKKPAERILNYLEKLGEIQSAKHGTSPNSKRTWNKQKLSEDPKKIIKRLEKSFSHFEKQLDKFEKNLDNFSPTEKISLATNFVKMIWMLDVNIKSEKIFYDTLDLSEFTKRHNSLKQRFFQIVEHSDDSFGIFEAIEREFNEIALNAEIYFEDELESF